jgi:hypothetical protein
MKYLVVDYHIFYLNIELQLLLNQYVYYLLIALSHNMLNNFILMEF